MIQVDSRAGSKDIAPILRALGIEVDLTMLNFGDLSWLGYGQNQSPISCGVELKSLSDILACVVSGRFSGHQLPGMLKSFDHVWLLVYGECRSRRDGILEQRKTNANGSSYWVEAGGGQRRWHARDLENWFMTCQVLGGVRLVRVATMQDAAQWVKTAWNWYQKDDHKSHLAMFSKDIFADSALLVKPPLVRRVAAELPSIGLSRSADVARQFKTVLEMAEASEERWMNLTVDDGKRLGVRGSTVYNAIRGHTGRNGRGR